MHTTHHAHQIYVTSTAEKLCKKEMQKIPTYGNISLTKITTDLAKYFQKQHVSACHDLSTQIWSLAGNSKVRQQVECMSLGVTALK